MDQYEIRRTVGRGHYGMVHVVECKLDKKEYILKDINLKGLSKAEVGTTVGVREGDRQK